MEEQIIPIPPLAKKAVKEKQRQHVLASQTHKPVYDRVATEAAAQMIKDQNAAARRLITSESSKEKTHAPKKTNVGAVLPKPVKHA